MRESVKSIKAWQHADQFVVDIYQATQGFPRTEIYGLTSQIRRAAVPVPANSAEGSQHYSLKEYRQLNWLEGQIRAGKLTRDDVKI